jgi:hypothetical protein
MKYKFHAIATLIFSFFYINAYCEYYRYEAISEIFDQATELQRESIANEFKGNFTGGEGETLNIGECHFPIETKKYKSNCLEAELSGKGKAKLIAYFPGQARSQLSKFNKGSTIAIKDCKIREITHWGIWVSIYCDVIPDGDPEMPAQVSAPPQQPIDSSEQDQFEQEQAEQELPSDDTASNFKSIINYNSQESYASLEQDWGSGIMARFRKTGCPIPEFKDQGYKFLFFTDIPESRANGNKDSYNIKDGRAVTVLGCWFPKDDNTAHLKMRRKKDMKTWERDIETTGGGWSLVIKSKPKEAAL